MCHGLRERTGSNHAPDGEQHQWRFGNLFRKKGIRPLLDISRNPTGDVVWSLDATDVSFDGQRCKSTHLDNVIPGIKLLPAVRTPEMAFDLVVFSSFVAMKPMTADFAFEFGRFVSSSITVLFSCMPA